MEYTVVTGDTIAEIEAAVRTKLDQLWDLQGGVGVTVLQGKVTLYQAMVRSPLALPDAIVAPPPVTPS